MARKVFRGKGDFSEASRRGPVYATSQKENLTRRVLPRLRAGQAGYCPFLEQRAGNMNAAKEPMTAPLRVLHLEDNSWDAELIRVELERCKVPCSISQIWTEKDFNAALEKGGFDIILSDSQLPGFQTLKALTRTREVYPSMPFIFVSGTTSPAMKANAFFRGATDFIPKDELPRLVSLVDGLFSASNSDGKIPEIGVPVVVQCVGFSCLGYLDRQGKWRDYSRSGELPAVIDWSEL
jgi:CheY-like chemotaxis protein